MLTLLVNPTPREDNRVYRPLYNVIRAFLASCLNGVPDHTLVENGVSWLRETDRTGTLATIIDLDNHLYTAEAVLLYMRAIAGATPLTVRICRPLTSRARALFTDLTHHLIKDVAP
jgi:hypothetical protein